MLKALVVDDDITVIKCFEKMIDWHTLGYKKPYNAVNGSDAYDIAISENVNVIISDLKMPVMGGLELARKLRHNDYKGEIILLSAYEDFSAAKEGIELKINDYLLKPIVMETIEKLSEKLKGIATKENAVSWVKKFIKDELDEEILNTLRKNELDYIETVFSTLYSLESMSGAREMFLPAVMKLVGIWCKYLSELGFSHSSVQYNREKLVGIIKNAHTNKEITDALYSKMSGIIKGTKKQKPINHHESIVYEIKKFIAGNYTKQDFCVGDISRAFHYSTDHINRVFKNEEGITASKYIVNYKMEKAKELLLESRLSVNEIAKKVGYNSISYFISSFKNYYKVTPASLREKNIKINLGENI